MSKKPEDFTSNQVAALVEDLKSDFRNVAEGVSALSEDVNRLKEDMVEVKADLTTIKDAVRVSIPSLNNRVTKLEAKVGI